MSMGLPWKRESVLRVIIVTFPHPDCSGFMEINKDGMRCADKMCVNMRI
jgi:hypothetical protein